MALLLAAGDLPDPDRNAHDMWALQLLEEGSLTISENGVTDNWRLYYPNTVPKPLELLVGILRAPGGVLYHSFLVLLGVSFVLVSAWYAGGRGGAGAAAAFFIGFNPVFILLAARGNPAIPFIGAMMLLQTAKGATAGALIASLSRPEGFIYGGWRAVKDRNWKLMLLLAASALVWLYFHRTACGSFTWASREVRYSVAAMNYPTPNSVTFLPWAGLRSILILGAPAAAVFYSGIKRWKLAVPFGANFALLTVSLSMGSLVLPRYIDQIFLLAAPFVFMEIWRLFRGRTRLAVVATALVFPSFQWIATLPEFREYAEVREFYSEVQLPAEGVTAANELLIPGIALNNSINDPRGIFVSSDRAAWEGTPEEDLKALNVNRIIVLDEGIYYPGHTQEWLDTMNDIEVNYFQ